IVSILSTGGTISSKVDYRIGGVYADYTAKDFVNMCPELSDIANIRARKIMSLMSEDMLPSDWIEISKIVESEIKEGVDGIVITQGTDTLHFSAAALSFMMQEHNIPILFTAAQRSIDRGSSDAFMNLICAVKAAASFDAAEVMTCLHGTSDDDHCLLIKGTKVRKMDTSRRDAFRPINALPYAKVYPNKDFEIIDGDYRKADRTKKAHVKLAPFFNDKVALHYVYPGMEPDVIDHYLKQGMKGIVIAATALGHVNTWTDKSLIPFLEKCHKKKVPVVITSQTLYGRVNPYVYTNLRIVSQKAHGIYVSDMHPETAYIKLGWVLGQTDDYEIAREMMLKNYKGEYTENLLPDMFLY
ncbi:MAG: Glu-tRNA(Gln) amidotransferase subunit GatD, partial [Nanoarchaeota archaeon]|nr:Glu-tRNA(Gln) amidotransferase subunit GatD [Nanoarchaeota archaeon]